MAGDPGEVLAFSSSCRPSPNLGSGIHKSVLKSRSRSQPCAVAVVLLWRGLGGSAWFPGGQAGSQQILGDGFSSSQTVRNKGTMGTTEAEDGENWILSSSCPVLRARIYLQCHSVSRGAS